MSDLVAVFALIALVLMVTALVSGLLEKSPLSVPLVFLGIGFVAGKGGFGVLEMGPHDSSLEVVAALTLSLVLFLDAVKLQLGELGKRWVVPLLVLGPGTVLIITLGAGSLALLIGFGWVTAFIGGAVLASTDPVVLREIIRDERIPHSVRQILKIEAGTNDVVVLPVIMVLIAVARSETTEVGEWVTLLAKLLILGPLIGLAVGGIGSWAMAKVDARIGIRREYQALYGIGMVLAAYSTATAFGGDGFLAAFAAGLAVVLFNQTLCDCFLEYGEITSEMAMLLAFVLFGATLSGMLNTVPFGPALILAGLVIFVIRPSVLGLVLMRANMSWEGVAFISWFGPRGLNSLLLALLVVQAGIGGSELLLATVGIVVFASVAVHGASARPITSWYSRRLAKDTLAEEREGTAEGLFSHTDMDIQRISVNELHKLLGEPNPPIVLDVRTRSTYHRDGYQIPGSIRVLPDYVEEWAADQEFSRPIITYCT